MKKHLLSLLFQFAALALFSQESINFLGGEVETASGSLSFSTAEIGIGHLETTEGWLTEGFQQPEIALADTTILVENAFLPHGFTPGDDGLNDLFDPVDFFEKRDKVVVDRTATTFTVVNRWGEIVFHVDSYPPGGWDGRAKTGYPLPMATYYFLLNLRFDGSQNEQLVKGPVTIVRR